MMIMTNKSNQNEIDSGKIALYSTSAILILLGVVLAIEKIVEYNKKKKLDIHLKNVYI